MGNNYLPERVKLARGSAPFDFAACNDGMDFTDLLSTLIAQPQGGL
jgi:hypothetical protein